MTDDLLTFPEYKIAKRIYEMISNDGFAISFQTMGQYRAALKKEILKIVCPHCAKDIKVFQDYLGVFIHQVADNGEVSDCEECQADAIRRGLK